MSKLNAHFSEHDAENGIEIAAQLPTSTCILVAGSNAANANLCTPFQVTKVMGHVSMLRWV